MLSRQRLSSKDYENSEKEKESAATRFLQNKDREREKRERNGPKKGWRQ